MALKTSKGLHRRLGWLTLVTVGGQIDEDEKTEFFRRAVAYLHPSRWESHSLGLVEALAYGIPSVVSVSLRDRTRTAGSGCGSHRRADSGGIAQGISAILRNPQQYRTGPFISSKRVWLGTRLSIITFGRLSACAMERRIPTIDHVTETCSQPALATGQEIVNESLGRT